MASLFLNSISDMKDKDFTPAEGVTLKNAMRYVAAIGEAVKKDIMKLPIEQRGFISSLIAGALHMEAQSIDKYRDGLIQAGQAIPNTDEQTEEFKWILRRIFEKNPDS